MAQECQLMLGDDNRWRQRDGAIGIHVDEVSPVIGVTDAPETRSATFVQLQQL
jgi:hypothetical protein